MVILLLTIALTIVAYLMCTKENFQIKRPKNPLFLSLALTLTIFLYLAFFSIWFLILFFAAFFLSAFLVIQKDEEYLSIFSKKIEINILIFAALSIVGVLIANFAEIYHSNKIFFSILFIIGAYLATTSRLGYIALCTNIAKQKNRSKFFGLLGMFLGIIGIIIICMVPKK